MPRPARRHLRLAATAAATAVVAVGTTAAALADPTPPARAGAVAPRWEYRWAVAQPGGRTVGDLEQLGKDGWEVVGPVNEYTADRWNFLLKRELPDG
ncbi:hypothetical protein KSE_01400 [Kitasatospora setae KM-6054]|uniref:DUF4177 domain-containing protein n=2 Tax=Streptomycetaceae TaxID=2062 RepID=E4N460_KITSK|nr:hypothetical protein KSE_01400 [Kitasatospora setae KM-6054]